MGDDYKEYMARILFANSKRIMSTWIDFTASSEVAESCELASKHIQCYFPDDSVFVLDVQDAEGSTF